MGAALPAVFLCVVLSRPNCQAAAAAPDDRCGEFVSRDMTLLSTTKLTPRDREALAKRVPGAQPGCVVTDFNSDGLKDAALIGQERKTGSVVLVIAVAKTDGSFDMVIRNPFGESMQGLFLLPYNKKTAEPTEAVEGSSRAQEIKGAAHYCPVK